MASLIQRMRERQRESARERRRRRQRDQLNKRTRRRQERERHEREQEQARVQAEIEEREAEVERGREAERRVARRASSWSGGGSASTEGAGDGASDEARAEGTGTDGGDGTGDGTATDGDGEGPGDDTATSGTGASGEAGAESTGTDGGDGTTQGDGDGDGEGPGDYTATDGDGEGTGDDTATDGDGTSQQSQGPPPPVTLSEDGQSIQVGDGEPATVTGTTETDAGTVYETDSGRYIRQEDGTIVSYEPSDPNAAATPPPVTLSEDGQSIQVGDGEPVTVTGTEQTDSGTVYQTDSGSYIRQEDGTIVPYEPPAPAEPTGPVLVHRADGNYVRMEDGGLVQIHDVMIVTDTWLQGNPQIEAGIVYRTRSGVYVLSESGEIVVVSGVVDEHPKTGVLEQTDDGEQFVQVQDGDRVAITDTQETDAGRIYVTDAGNFLLQEDGTLLEVQPTSTPTEPTAPAVTISEDGQLIQVGDGDPVAVTGTQETENGIVYETEAGSFLLQADGTLVAYQPPPPAAPTVTLSEDGQLIQVGDGDPVAVTGTTETENGIVYETETGSFLLQADGTLVAYQPPPPAAPTVTLSEDAQLIRVGDGDPVAVTGTTETENGIVYQTETGYFRLQADGTLTPTEQPRQTFQITEEGIFLQSEDGSFVRMSDGSLIEVTDFELFGFGDTGAAEHGTVYQTADGIFVYHAERGLVRITGHADERLIRGTHSENEHGYLQFDDGRVTVVTDVEQTEDGTVYQTEAGNFLVQEDGSLVRLPDPPPAAALTQGEDGQYVQVGDGDPIAITGTTDTEDGTIYQTDAGNFLLQEDGTLTRLPDPPVTATLGQSEDGEYIQVGDGDPIAITGTEETEEGIVYQTETGNFLLQADGTLVRVVDAPTSTAEPPVSPSLLQNEQGYIQTRNGLFIAVIDVSQTDEGTIYATEDGSFLLQEDGTLIEVRQAEPVPETGILVEGEDGQYVQVGDGEPVAITGTRETEDGTVYETEAGSFLLQADGTVVAVPPADAPAEPTEPAAVLVEGDDGQFVQIGDGEPMAVTDTETTEDGVTVYQTESGAYTQGDDGNLVPYEPPIEPPPPTTATLVEEEEGSFVQADDGERIAVTGTTETSLGIVYETDRGNYVAGEDGSLIWIGEGQYNLNTLDGRLAAIGAPYDAQITHMNDYLNSLLEIPAGRRNRQTRTTIENLQTQIAQLEAQRNSVIETATAHFNNEQAHQNSIGAFNTSIEQYNADTSNLQQQITSYNTTSALFELMLDPFSDLGEELSSQEATITTQKEELDTAQANIEGLIEPITTFDEEHQDTFDTYTADFERYEADQATLEAAQTDFNADVEAYETAVEEYNSADPPTREMYDALEAQFEALQTKSDNLQTQADAFNELVTSLQERQPQIQALADERQGYVDAYNEAYPAYEALVNSYNEAITEYQSDYSQYQQMHSELQPVQAQLQAQLGNIQTLQTDLQTRSEGLQTQQTTLTTHGGNLSEQYGDIFSGRPRQFEYQMGDDGTPATEIVTRRELTGSTGEGHFRRPVYDDVPHEVHLLTEDADIQVDLTNGDGATTRVAGFDDEGTAYYRDEHGTLVPIQSVGSGYNSQAVVGWATDGQPILGPRARAPRIRMPSTGAPEEPEDDGNPFSERRSRAEVRAIGDAALEHYRLTGETQWQGAGGGLPIGSTSSDDNDGGPQPAPDSGVIPTQADVGVPTQFDLQTAALLDDIVGPGLGTLGEEIEVTAPGSGLAWGRHIIQSEYDAEVASRNLGTDGVVITPASVDDSPVELAAPSPAPFYLGEGGPIRSETPSSTREERDAARNIVTPYQPLDEYGDETLDLGRRFDADTPDLEYDLNYNDDRRPPSYDDYEFIELGQSFDADTPTHNYDLNYYDDRRQDLDLQSGDDLASGVFGDSGRFTFDGPDIEFDLNYYDDRRQDLDLQSGDDLASGVLGDSGRFTYDGPDIEFDLNYYDDPEQQRLDRLGSMTAAFDADERADAVERRQMDLWGEFILPQDPTLPTYSADERLQLGQGYVDLQNRHGAGFFGRLGGTLHDFGAEIASAGRAETPTFNQEEIQQFDHDMQLLGRETHSTDEYIDLGDAFLLPGPNADERLRMKRGIVDTENRYGAGFWGGLGGRIHDVGAEIVSGGAAYTPTFNREEIRDYMHQAQLDARETHSTSEHLDLGERGQWTPYFDSIEPAGESLTGEIDQFGRRVEAMEDTPYLFDDAEERLRMKQGIVDTESRYGAGFWGRLGGRIHDVGAEIVSEGEAHTPTFNREEIRDYMHQAQLDARETHSTSEHLDLGDAVEMPYLPARVETRMPRNEDGSLPTPAEYIATLQEQGIDSLTPEQQQILFYLEQLSHGDRVEAEVEDWYESRARAFADAQRYAELNPDSITVSRDEWIRVGTDQDSETAIQRYREALEARSGKGVGIAGYNHGYEPATDGNLSDLVAPLVERMVGASVKYVEPQGDAKVIGGAYDTAVEILTLSQAHTPSYNPESGIQAHDAYVEGVADLIQNQTLTPEEAEQQAEDFWRDGGREAAVSLRQQILLENANPTMDEAMAAATDYFETEGRDQAIAKLENRLIAQANRPQDDAGVNEWARQTAIEMWEAGGHDVAVESLASTLMAQANRPQDDAGVNEWARQTATAMWEETGRDAAIDAQTQALLGQANPDMEAARTEATTLFDQVEQGLIRSTAEQIREQAFMTPVQIQHAAEADFETNRPEMVQEVADDIREDHQALADSAHQQAEAYYREEEPALLEETVQNMISDGWSEAEARQRAPALLAGARDEMIAQAAADIRSHHEWQVDNADNIASEHVDSLRDGIVSNTVLLYQNSIVTNRDNAVTQAEEYVSQYRPEWIEQTAGQIMVDRTMTQEQARQQATVLVDANRPAAIENMASQLMQQTDLTPEQARVRAAEIIDAQAEGSIERMAGQLMTMTAMDPAQIRQIATQHIDENSDEILRSLAGNIMAHSTLSDTAALQQAQEFVNGNESALVASTRDLLLNPQQIERDDAVMEAQTIVGKQLAESGVAVEDGDTHSAFAENVYESQPDLGYLGKELALSSIPIVGTVRNWDDNTNWGRGLDIALDIAGIIPAIGQAGRVARSYGSMGRTAYTFASGALMPLDPEGIRGMFSPRAVPEFGREWQRLIRMGSDPNTIPLAALENQFSTVRPPVDAFGDIPLSEKYVMRDAAMWNLMKTGQDTAVRLPDGNYLIYRGGVQQDVGEGAFHTAPSGEAFDPYFRHRDIPDDPASMYKPRHELGGDITYEDHMLLNADLYHSATPHTRFVPVDSSGFRTGHGRSMILFQRDPEFMSMYKNFDIDDPSVQTALRSDTGNIPLARWSGSDKRYQGALEGELIAEGGGLYRVGIPNRYTVLDPSSGNMKAIMRPNKEWWEAALIHKETGVPYRKPGSRTGELNIDPRTGQPFRHFTVPKHEVGLRGDSPAELRMREEGFEFVPARDRSGRPVLDDDGNPMPSWNRYRDSWDWQREPVAPWQMHGKKMPWDDEVELRIAGPDFTTQQKWNLKLRGIDQVIESLHPKGLIRIDPKRNIFSETQQGWKIRSSPGDAYVITDQDLARWADVERPGELRPWDSGLTDAERADSRRVIAAAQRNAAHISGARVQARLATGRGFTDPEQFRLDSTLERRDPNDLEQRNRFELQDSERQERLTNNRDEARRFYQQEEARRMETLRDEGNRRSRIRHRRWWNDPRLDPDRIYAPRGEAPRVDAPRIDSPRTNTVRIDTPRIDPNRVDTPRGETPRTELPRTDAPRGDAPRGDLPRTGIPRLDAPRAGMPRLDAPRIDTPRLDVPRVDVPRIDTPRLDMPRVDVPRIDTPRLDVPRVDVPRIDTPRLTPPGPGRTRIPPDYRPGSIRPPFDPPSKPPRKTPKLPSLDGSGRDPKRQDDATEYPARITWYKDDQVHELDLHTNKRESKPAFHDATPPHETVEITQFTEAAPPERFVELGDVDVKVGANGIQYVSIDSPPDSSEMASVELAAPPAEPSISVDLLPDGATAEGQTVDVNVVEADITQPDTRGGMRRSSRRPASVSTSRRPTAKPRRTAAPRRKHPFLSRGEQRMV